MSWTTLSQVSSDSINSLGSVHNFCKSEMNGAVWFDYDKCDSNSVTIYQKQNAYSFKLTSIAKVEVAAVTKKKKSIFAEGGYKTVKLKDASGSDILGLIIVTYPAAKIKREYHSFDYSNDYTPGGYSSEVSDNGLRYINQLTLFGDLEKLKELKLLLETSVERAN